MLTTKTLLVIIVILGSAIVVKAGVYYSADTPPEQFMRGIP